MVTLICHSECSNSNTHLFEIHHLPWLEWLSLDEKTRENLKFENREVHLGSIYNEICMI